MRYIALALALLVLCAAVCVWNMVYVCRCLEQLESSAVQALEAAGREEYAQCAQNLARLQEQLELHQLYFSAVLPHAALDTVSLSLETAQGLVQAHSPELASQLRVLCRSLRMLMDTEQLRLGNVL